MRSIRSLQREIAAGEAGFTLIELLVVIVIIGLLAGLVGPRMFGKVEKAKQNTARAQIELFATALEAFHLDVGRYPTAVEGLEALRTKPQGLDTWDGPYLRKNIPLDPWGKPYVYASPGEHGDFDLVSFGADAVPGGEGSNSDVVSWE